MTDFSAPLGSPDSEPSTDIRSLIGLNVPAIGRRDQIAAEIRAALEEFASQEVLDILQDPEFRPMIIDTFKMSLSPSAQMLEERFEPLPEGDEWKRGENSEEAAVERMDSNIDDLFESPELLEKMAKMHASARYLGSREIDEMFRMMKSVLESNGADPALIGIVEDRHEALMKHFVIQQGIMERLVDRAQTGGIESVCSRDAETQAVKEVFPTAESYRTHIKTASELSETYNLALVRAFFSADTEQAKFISTVLGGVVRGKGIMEMMGCEIQNTLLERDIARIYRN